MVLPEDLCSRLALLATEESRTVSNMAKVLIQEGVDRYTKEQLAKEKESSDLGNTEGFRSALEAQEPKRLKGAPRRLRLYRPFK